MDSGGTLVEVSTSCATIIADHAFAFPIWSFACAFVTTSGVKAVSISIAHIVIVIETFINIGTDGTIFVGVTGNTGTAKSTSVHCVCGNTTDPFHCVCLSFIGTNRSTFVAIVVIATTFIVINTSAFRKME